MKSKIIHAPCLCFFQIFVIFFAFAISANAEVLEFSQDQKVLEISIQEDSEFIMEIELDDLTPELLRISSNGFDIKFEQTGYPIVLPDEYGNLIEKFFIVWEGGFSAGKARFYFDSIYEDEKISFSLNGGVPEIMELKQANFVEDLEAKENKQVTVFSWSNPYTWKNFSIDWSNKAVWIFIGTMLLAIYLAYRYFLYVYTKGLLEHKEVRAKNVFSTTIKNDPVVIPLSYDKKKRVTNTVVSKDSRKKPLGEIDPESCM